MSDFRDIGFDTETWLIAPGRLAPRPVSGAWHDGSTGRVLARPDAMAYIQEVLADRQVRIVGANIAYDMAVVCQENPDLLGPVFEAYDDGRIVDVKVAERLRKLALGWDEFD